MIKLVTPKVYLIARPILQWYGGMGNLLKDEGLENLSFMDSASTSAEMLVEWAGRICYMSYGKGRKTTEDMVRNLVASGHHSVLEHANWTLLITGISRSLSHEFVRHRHFSYSQLSQRYVDSSEVAFVAPSVIEENAELFRYWKRDMEIARNAYVMYERILMLAQEGDTETPKTLKTKLARQAARSVLPNATETKMVVTGNARAWMHFFEMRGSIHADVEIRRLAVMILKTLKPEAPTIFENYTVTTEGIISVERASSGKVGTNV